MRKKLIEVALPLDAINKAAAREKSIRHGHPSTLHLWWARRPLAAARAVIFAQMVDDPSSWPELFATEAEQEKERQRLFRLIEELVQWENTTNEELLERAREEIRASWRRTCAENRDHARVAELFDPERLPAFHDPFAGGGTLPLEAQRLGLEAHASDLNPVAVLINKAMIEIPPKFAGMPPVNPEWRAKAKDNPLEAQRQWKGAQGLAEDVRYYGKWMRDEAEKRIGHLYPKVEVTAEMAKERPDLRPYQGRKLTVIAWLWARTVKSPNPAFRDLDVPLASTFRLSTKVGKEAYVEPVIEGQGYCFTVKVPGSGAPGNAGVPPARRTSVSKDGAENLGVPPAQGDGAYKSGAGTLDLSPAQGTKLGRGANFRCLMSGTPISGDYIKAEGQAGRMGARLMAIVAEGDSGRVYLAPTSEHEKCVREAVPEWKPDVEFFQQALGFRVGNYGMTKWSDLFTPRQLVALTNFSDFVKEAIARVKQDALEAGASRPLEDKGGGTNALPKDETSLRSGGVGAAAYAEAAGVYLAFAISKLADRGSTICTWFTERDSTRNTFARQSIPMTWDYAELNTLLYGTGSFLGALEWTAESIEGIARIHSLSSSASQQADATSQLSGIDKVVSTDPPYYDNVGYADLSDFFYVWLRRSLRSIFPDLFDTLAVPKDEELVATIYRHGSKDKAETFFLKGMARAMQRLAEQAHPSYPVTIYYAFKQAERKGDAGIASTGWETFLDAVIRSGFTITGTWPTRTELANRMRGMSSNALASSIVLVCRKRPEDAPLATRRQFIDSLKSELPVALAQLQSGSIAPVDLAQAAIGPGMAVYTRYAKVVDSTGNPVTVREALALINETLDEVLSTQEGDFDADTRWALAWFEQHGFEDGDYGVAETLSKAKNTSVFSLKTIGVLRSKGGKVRLLIPLALRPDWDPRSAGRVSAWLSLHHLIRIHDAGGEQAAAAFVRKLGGVAETARELAYRLYALAERTKRSREALWYNALVQSWPEIARLARQQVSEQAEMLATIDGEQEG